MKNQKPVFTDDQFQEIITIFYQLDQELGRQEYEKREARKEKFYDNFFLFLSGVAFAVLLFLLV